MSENANLTLEEISSISLFQGLSEYDLYILSEYLKKVEFKACEYVFKEGEPYGSAYFLLQGSVQILKHVENKARQQVLAEIKVPQMFGELALISRGSRSASVLTLEPVVVAEFNCEDFERFIKTQPELAINVTLRIAYIISNRLKISNKNYVRLCSEMETTI